MGEREKRNRDAINYILFFTLCPDYWQVFKRFSQSFFCVLDFACDLLRYTSLGLARRRSLYHMSYSILFFSISELPRSYARIECLFWSRNTARRRINKTIKFCIHNLAQAHHYLWPLLLSTISRPFDHEYSGRLSIYLDNLNSNKRRIISWITKRFRKWRSLD